MYQNDKGHFFQISAIAYIYLVMWTKDESPQLALKTSNRAQFSSGRNK
jgi:hypothetical protein